MKQYLTAIFLALILLACTAPAADTATEPSEEEEPSYEGEFEHADHVSVDVMVEDWTGDGEPDGNVVYPSIIAANGSTLQFEPQELPVTIEIWTTSLNDDFEDVKDDLVYEGEGIIDEWEDGNRLLEGDGIRVPFSEIDSTTDDLFGLMVVKIETPQGPVKGTSELAQLRAD